MTIRNSIKANAMPITKTAKRALRSSRKKEQTNKTFVTRFEIAIREAKNKKTKELVRKAISLTDKAEKKNLIHQNKANRIKGRLAALLIDKASKK